MKIFTKRWGIYLKFQKISDQSKKKYLKSYFKSKYTPYAKKPSTKSRPKMTEAWYAYPSKKTQKIGNKSKTGHILRSNGFFDL